jgi:hypothetical protein
MTGKRKGKEIDTTGGAGGRKKPSKYHGINLKGSDQKDRYNLLISKPIHTCKYADDHTMISLGIRENVVRLFETIGWSDLMRPRWGYENFTYEFLSSLVFSKDKTKKNIPEHTVAFRLLGQDYNMSLEKFNEDMGFPSEGYIHECTQLKPEDYNVQTFWKSISGLDECNSQANKASRIHNPVLRYIQRVMGFTIFGRREPGPARTDELFLLWAMLNNRPVNTGYYMLDHLASLTTKRSGEIIVGGIITFIAEKLGVGEDLGTNRIEGNPLLNIEKLALMNFFVDLKNGTYQWKIDGATTGLFLPNPARTNTWEAENLLYDDLQVPEVQVNDGGDEEEAQHEQEEPVLHAGPQFEYDRWAWVQAEFQKVHTKQNQMHNEMIGMRADIQHGNRVAEESQRLVTQMMQRFGLNRPPPGNN